jgi:GntR family transcriptional regulator, transcriptional repressor for pyruvate dehydrogenase complex
VANLTPILPHLGPTNLRDRVVGLLERGIIEGQFVAGGRLPTEIQLGAQLGVSRTVVRDALRVLEARGLIEIRRGAGTRVRESTAHAYVNAAAMLLIRSELTVGDVLEARAALESHLAVIAAQNRTQENVDQIQTALDAFAHAVDDRNPAAAARCHVEFHTQLVRATRLPALDILIRPLQQMMLATSLVPTGLEPDDPKGWRVEAHRDLFLAVESQSMEALAKAADVHWAYTLGVAFDGLREQRIGELYASPAQRVDELETLP